MSRIVQEKFEVRPPQNHNDEESGWVSDSSARTNKNLRTRAPKGMYERAGSALNDLPPGMNIEDQNLADIDSQPMASGNMGNGTQVTTDVTSKSLREGYQPHTMRSTDDMWTNEHQDAFYGEINVDGVTGFLERNNMLDRS